ncbi:MAG: hypothetical protein V4615_02575 [Bacteroidota bacterium]
MQRIFRFAILFTAHFLPFNVSAQNISDLDAFEKAIKPGTVLTYNVTMGEKKYQLIATLQKTGNEISFDWETTAPAGKKGNIAMNANAVSKADALYTDFSGGETKLDKETCFFISSKVFNEIASTAQANLKLSGATDTVTVLSNTISEFNFSVNDNLVAVPGWELEGGSEIKYTIDVLESVKFPLIVRMDLGWTIQLASIKNP